MKLGLTVETTDGHKRLSIVQFTDFCAFEEEHNVSMAQIEVSMKVRDLAWLAWHAEKRNKVHALGFVEWRDTIAMVSMGDTEDNKIVPLESSQPTG